MENKQNMAINKKQIEIITNFMSDHNDLARGILKTAQGRKNSSFLWERLSNSLNTEGPPQKDIKDWKKTWSDLKYKVKNKLRSNKLHLKGTGGGPYMQKKIDEWEEKIIECAGLEAAVEGVLTAKLFGAPHNNTTDNNNNDTNNIKSSEPKSTYIPATNTTSNFENEENSLEEESDIEYEGNPTYKTNVRTNKKETKENLMRQYVNATEGMNTKLGAIHELLISNQKIHKRRLEVEEKLYRLKKKKLEIYEKNGVERLRLQEIMLSTKIEENRIRLREIESQQ